MFLTNERIGGMRFLTIILLCAFLLGAVSTATVGTRPATAAAVVETYNYAGTADVDQTLDAYYNPSADTGRWVAVFHGGSWSAGSKANTAAASEKLRAAGFTVFNVAYRLTSTYGSNIGSPWPAQRDDGLDAIAWIKAHAAQFGIDPDRGAVYGFSAGGHIAAQVGLYGNGGARVNAIVSASGVLQPHRVQDVADSDPATGHGGDLPTQANKTLARWEAVALGCPRLPSWTDCNARWNDFLPETHISADDPPVMMFQGTADPSVPPQSARSFQYWLNTKQVPNTLTECVNWTHTEACAFDGGTRQQQLINFLTTSTA
jgi:acetyl esterase/lipase